MTERPRLGGDVVSDNVCRVSVYSGVDEPSTLVDLTLPARIPLAALLPDIVGLAASGGAPPGRPWRLARVGGPELDARMSLRDHGVEDGELLVLWAVDVVAPRFHRTDLLSEVLTAAPQPRRRPVRPAAGSAAALIGALTCIGSPSGGLVAVATVVALLCGVMLAAVTWSRAHRAAHGPLSVVAVAVAAVCGIRIVPGDLALEHLSLAAAAAATTSLLLLRCRAGQTTAMTASAAISLLVATVTFGAVLWPMPAASVGALLTLSALAGLGTAPRLSVILAGLAPATVACEPDDAGDQRAATGHRVLAGLVLGYAAVSAAGAVTVGVAALRDSAPWAAAGLSAVTGVALMLRARTFVSWRCRAGLLIAGFVCAVAALTIAVVAVPAQAHWVGAILVGAGTVTLVRDGSPASSPITSRAVDILEYVALAAVTPLACAILGVFGLVRGLSIG